MCRRWMRWDIVCTGFGAHLPDAGCETAAGVHGLYRYEEKFEIVKEQYITDIHALIAELNERGERVIFLGTVCRSTGR